MNSVTHDITNDSEPRQLPKPAPRFDSPPVPSVPEVSLVFDKPSDPRSFDYNTRRSPSIDKYDSYATWKQTAVLSNGTNNPSPKSRRSVGSTLERSYSQSEANQLHKNLVINESIRHSRSDPSLIKKITQGYEERMQNRRTMSPIKDNDKKNDTRGRTDFENHFRNVDVDRQQYFSQNRNEEVYGDRDDGRLNHSNLGYNDDRYSTRHGNPMGRQQRAYVDANNENSGSHRVAVSTNRLQGDYQNAVAQNTNYLPNVFPRYHQFPPYCDTEYGYPYPHPFSPNIQTQRNENEETVKNLLQLINNQSEQIKALQSQVERLLKIQEESLKDREKCNCSRNLGLVNENYEQNTQLSIQTTNNNPVHCSANSFKSSRDETTVPQRHNGTMERNMIGSTNIKEIKKNLTCDNHNNQNNDGRLNSVSRDEQLKNKILEQKVSIGVMTSFEFTVQNNPFAQETDDHRPHYGQNQTEINNDTENNDVARTCQNVFSRVSNLPLENIIEDSESHLSVSQQPSSNFHSSPTIDECKSSELANKKNGRNISMGQSPESNAVYSNNKNSEDLHDGNYVRENYSINQRKQFFDAQENLKKTRRSQAADNQTAQIPWTEDTPRQYYPEINSPVLTDRRRQDPIEQNFVPRTGNKNISSSVPHNSTANGTKQFNERRESNSPFRFEDRKHSNGPGNDYDNAGLLGRQHEPRSRESPAAYNKETNRISSAKKDDNNCIEESMVLNSGELEINERPPPSPEPSIHVEMQEYSSDEDSDKHGVEIDKQTPKVGWTFYNNVLGQVNQILQNSPITRNLKEKTTDRENVIDDQRNKATVETVKIATMEQLRQLGISFVDNNDSKDVGDTSNKKVTFDSSYYPRLEYRGNMTQATSTMSETDTSMHMNALALKYLSDEQLGELAMQKHSAETLKHLMVSNVQGTNMSFATMRYLERYQLLPTNNNPQVDNERRTMDKPRIEEFRNVRQRPPTSSQMARMSCPSKILDISTLKQQPKLL